MGDLEVLATSFQQKREHLRSIAQRMLGSAAEAEDAVQGRGSVFTGPMHPKSTTSAGG